MSTKKTTSPEAEQQKLWKLEIKQLEKVSRKQTNDCAAEAKRSKKEVLAAQRAAAKARKNAAALEKKHDQLCTRLTGAHRRGRDKIERRISFLKGRLGL